MGTISPLRTNEDCVIANNPGSVPSRLRADALRNRNRILEAARDVFAEQGADAPLDDIARRAGVGSATLYRRFPDRGTLIREVAINVLQQAALASRTALAEEPDAFSALARYMHRALDLRISSVMPVLAPRLSPDSDSELKRARDESTALLIEIIDRAQREGLLRADVAFGDIGLTIIRLARPLPSPIPRELSDRLAHRHLEIYLAGLRAPGAAAISSSLSGPALSLDDLRTVHLVKGVGAEIEERA